jgi:hypothetical protein
MEFIKDLFIIFSGQEYNEADNFYIYFQISIHVLIFNIIPWVGSYVNVYLDI